MAERPWCLPDQPEETGTKLGVPRFHSRRNRGPSTNVAAAPWPQTLGHGRLLSIFRKIQRKRIGEEGNRGKNAAAAPGRKKREWLGARVWRGGVWLGGGEEDKEGEEREQVRCGGACSLPTFGGTTWLGAPHACTEVEEKGWWAGPAGVVGGPVGLPPPDLLLFFFLFFCRE